VSRFCGCGAPIRLKSTTGRCVKCAAADPDVRAAKGKLTPEQRARRSEHAKALSADPTIVAKRKATQTATWADPALRERHAKACQTSKAVRMKNPAFRALLSENGKRYGARNLLLGLAPEVRKRAAETLRRNRMAWCPEEHWGLNRLLKQQGFLIDERKQIILAGVPGTVQHARRTIANITDAMRIKQERERAQAY
jgi:hypothetical protein